MGISVTVLQSRGGSKNGVVQFIGTTEFAGGNWVGVELDTPDGLFYIASCNPHFGWKYLIYLGNVHTSFLNTPSTVAGHWSQPYRNCA